VFSRETLVTGETVAETARSLTALIQPRLAALDRNKASRPFVGTIDADGFAFHRIITGTRGFEVTVRGRIVHGADGAELRMVFRVAVPVVIYAVASLAPCSVWCQSVRRMMSRLSRRPSLSRALCF
jgi:hypothetical protein